MNEKPKRELPPNTSTAGQGINKMPAATPRPKPAPAKSEPSKQKK